MHFKTYSFSEVSNDMICNSKIRIQAFKFLLGFLDFQSLKKSFRVSPIAIQVSNSFHSMMHFLFITFFRLKAITTVAYVNGKIRFLFLAQKLGKGNIPKVILLAYFSQMPKNP